MLSACIGHSKYQTCRTVRTAPIERSHEATESSTSAWCVRACLYPRMGFACCTTVACRSAWTTWRQRCGGNCDGALDCCPTLAPSRTRASVDPDALPAAAPCCISGATRIETLECKASRAETCRRLVLKTHFCTSIPSTFEVLTHSTPQWHDCWTGAKEKLQPMKPTDWRCDVGSTIKWLMIQRCSSQASTRVVLASAIQLTCPLLLTTCSYFLIPAFQTLTLFTNAPMHVVKEDFTYFWNFAKTAKPAPYQPKARSQEVHSRHAVSADAVSKTRRGTHGSLTQQVIEDIDSVTAVVEHVSVATPCCQHKHCGAHRIFSSCQQEKSSLSPPVSPPLPSVQLWAPAIHHRQVGPSSAPLTCGFLDNS